MSKMFSVIRLLLNGVQCCKGSNLLCVVVNLNYMAFCNCFCRLMGNTHVLIVDTGFTALFMMCHVVYGESLVRHVVP
jgi:hypothetical protein